jgi:hypothetical protein
MALRVHFERPTSQVELEREVDRMRLGGAAKGAQAVGGLRRIARRRLERIGRLKFHVAAWALSMVVLSPLWALIEWQDNGGFERFSDNGKPGSWEAWIFYVGGIWALVIVFFALYVYLARPETDAAIERVVRLLRSRRWRKEA